VNKFIGFEVIFSILIVELELGAEFLPYGTFKSVELVKGLCAVRTAIVATFMNSDFTALLPDKEGATAVGTKILGSGGFTKFPFKLK
jgi:hypothetical protein